MGINKGVGKSVLIGVGMVEGWGGEMEGGMRGYFDRHSPSKPYTLFISSVSWFPRLRCTQLG